MSVEEDDDKTEDKRAWRSLAVIVGFFAWSILVGTTAGLDGYNMAKRELAKERAALNQSMKEIGLCKWLEITNFVEEQCGDKR